MRRASPIFLTPVDRRELVRLTKKRTFMEIWNAGLHVVNIGPNPAAVAAEAPSDKRIGYIKTLAQIILRAADGEKNTEIAEALNFSRPTVGYWREKYIREGISGLFQKERRGRKPAEPVEIIRDKIAARLKTPAPSGAPWSVRGLAVALGYTTSTVSRALKKKPEITWKQGFGPKEVSPFQKLMLVLGGEEKFPFLFEFVKRELPPNSIWRIRGARAERELLKGDREGVSEYVEKFEVYLSKNTKLHKIVNRRALKKLEEIKLARSGR